MEVPLDVLEAKYGDDTDEEVCMGEVSISSQLPAVESMEAVDDTHPIEVEEDYCEEAYYEEEDEDSDEDVIAALEWADMRDGGSTYCDCCQGHSGQFISKP